MSKNIITPKEWREQHPAELTLMDDPIPLLTKRTQGREIPGLSVYEQ